MLRPGVTENEVRYAQQKLREELEEKYSSVTKAFKFIDADRTGKLEREEVKRLLIEFNIVNVRDDAIETLIDFADFDGDGEINYAEFARILTADDVMAMKQTTTAVDGAIKLGRGDQPLAENYAVGAKTLEGVKTGLGRH